MHSSKSGVADHLANTEEEALILVSCTRLAFPPSPTDHSDCKFNLIQLYILAWSQLSMV